MRLRGALIACALLWAPAASAFAQSAAPLSPRNASYKIVVNLEPRTRTITGDSVCRATNVAYRLDTESARSFLAPYVTLP